MQADILELRQTGENDWKARYQGNYGIYTIKITLRGNKAARYSCTCPSDYQRCKHIGMIENAIAEKTAVYKKAEKSGGPKLSDFIEHVPIADLRKFIINRTKLDPELLNAAYLDFSVYIKNKHGNKYSYVIKKALASFTYDSNDYYGSDDNYYDDDDYYNDEEYGEYKSIDILDQWIKKAWGYMEFRNYKEAMLISTAIIEEYSEWLYKQGSCKFCLKYESEPFKILEKILRSGDRGKSLEMDLLKFCQTEVKKKKYTKTGFYDLFLKLTEQLTLESDPEVFIALQDELLADISDKSSQEAKAILERKINFYKRIKQEDKAWAVMEENLQIESFCEELLKKKMEDGNYTAAKKIIGDIIENHKKEKSKQFFDNKWYDMLLDIAQKENDIPAIRELSFDFIKTGFNKRYYDIYKSAFSLSEWASESEKLFRHYTGEKYFNSSAADFLEAEDDTKRLFEYVRSYTEKNNSFYELERYYKVFAPDYPAETLELFKKVLVSFAENSTGRNQYEKIVSILQKMSRIKGGRTAVSKIAEDFTMRYKTRKVMIKMLERFE